MRADTPSDEAFAAAGAVIADILLRHAQSVPLLEAA